MLITVTKKVEFCSAHRLYNEKWSAEKNFEVFGKCSNEYGHGHNYELSVSVSGPLDPESGMIVNVSLLGQMLKREIVQKLDHCNLNTDVEFLKDNVTTMENMVVLIAKQLDSPLADMGLELYKLELSESNKNKVTLEK